MTTTRLLGAAAFAALMGGAAFAQSPAQSAQAPAVPPAAAPATPTAGQLVAKGDIVDTLKADGHFGTFVKALEAANMTGVLKTNSNLTVFAPNDAAFAALPPGELDRLMKDPAALQKLLTYHVVNATVDSTKIKGAKGGVKTVAGSDLMLDGSGDMAMANNAHIVQADVRATNGTVHVVDKVLQPGGAATASAAVGASTDAAATTPAQPAKPAEPQATPPSSDEPEVPGEDAKPGKPAPDQPPGEKPRP
ncbi:fasciclin domain-containing protein [Caulobacter mirabilis]|nr:fasciclin domain-containing protein [Caulobacter mirabilis]